MHVEDVEDTEMHPKTIFSEQRHNLFQTNELFFFLERARDNPISGNRCQEKEENQHFFFFFSTEGA